ncbi:MAG: hypothetical protein QME52_09380 [Bacteroidota bacterium]|nr:hypothetical protein [Bacteroidota bacterium]
MMIATALIFPIINGLLNLHITFLQHSILPPRKEELTKVYKIPIDTSSISITSDIRLVNVAGDTIYGRIRQPLDNTKKYPVAFLIVGIETGKNVVDMITGYDNVIVFGMDYPFTNEMNFTGWKGISTLFELRKLGFRTIPQIYVCLDWLSSLSCVDTNDITIIAVSFGVFTAIPAAVRDKRVDRLVVVQGGGNLHAVLEANADRLGFSMPAWLAGWFGSIVLAPFEPNDYIAELSPRPLLVVSGESDILFPQSSVQSLFYNAREPKEWIKHHSTHVAPGEEELILELTNIVGKRLYSKK